MPWRVDCTREFNSIVKLKISWHNQEHSSQSGKIQLTSSIDVVNISHIHQPPLWLTFWFGGQSSTVLQGNKHNSEKGCRLVWGKKHTHSDWQSYLMQKIKSFYLDKHTYCLRRRSFWNSFRSFSSVGNSYRSSKTHLYRVWQRDREKEENKDEITPTISCQQLLNNYKIFVCLVNQNNW